MRYRLLGRTGLFVSEFGLGTNTFGGSGARWQAYGALSREEATRVVGAAWDRGINIIDTADSYAAGEAEERVGTSIKDLKLPRSDVILCSKVYQRMGPGANNVGLSRSHVIDGLEASLRRLNTDYLDLYFLHSFDPLTPIEETLGALDLLRRQGKIRYVGCSNFAGWQIAVAQAASRAEGLPRLEVAEMMYTIAARGVEDEVVPALDYHDMSLMVWGGLGAGLLTGKYDRSGKGPEGARLSSGASTIAEQETALDAVDAMRPIAEAKGLTIAQVALAWLATRPRVASIVIGCKTVEQLEGNLGALDVEFTEAEFKTLEAIGRRSHRYPYNMQDSMAARRGPAGA
jgi:aryl-alcohol dehydrogenase-like predicted oxidoreductase